MKSLILMMVAAAFAIAGEKICFRIKPFCPQCGNGEDVWVIEYKKPGRTSFWQQAHERITFGSYCNLNPLLVNSIEEGRETSLDLSRAGIDQWERQERSAVKACQDRVDKENRRLAEAAKKKPARKPMATVEICPQ